MQAPWPGSRPESWLGVIGVAAEGGRLLLIRRAPGIRAGGLWCFPGGAVEPGETAREAVQRELQEELGATCDVLGPLGVVRPPGKRWRLLAWRVRLPDGGLAPDPEEVAETAWLTPEEVRALPDGLPSNRRVLELLARRHPA